MFIEIYLNYFISMSGLPQDYMKSSENIKLIPANSTFDLQATLAKALKYVSSHKAGRSIVLHPTEVLSSTLKFCSHVISDEHWLLENTMCLLSNSVKYSDKGAVVDIRVSVTTNGVASVIYGTSLREVDSSEEPLVVVCVQDTGIGISETARSRLFQPFEQAQRRAGGTGLGLYSLAKRMEALGGSCGSRTRLDGRQGSLFWLSFPYRPDFIGAAHAEAEASLDAAHDSDEKAIAMKSSDVDARVISPFQSTLARSISNASKPEYHKGSSSSASKAIGAVKTLRILLVDDTPTIIKVTNRVLETKGHFVESCENGNQSLERLKATFFDDSQRFDFVVTDLQMPIMDGFESTKRYRMWEAEERKLLEMQGRLLVPSRIIIGMSANSDAESQQEAIDAGMDDFLAKPFQYKEFERVLKVDQRLLTRQQRVAHVALSLVATNASRAKGLL